MICSSCNAVYRPATEELGRVESISGFCNTCGTEPRLKRFAVAFTGGAVAGVLTLEFLLLLFLIGGATAILIPPLVVAVICLLVYGFASRSEPVRYRDVEHRRKETVGHRVGGWWLGYAVGVGTMLVFLDIW